MVRTPATYFDAQQSLAMYSIIAALSVPRPRKGGNLCYFSSSPLAIYQACSEQVAVENQLY
jgi:hypothetical protein